MADISAEAVQAALNKVQEIVPDSKLFCVQCDVSSDKSVSEMISFGERHLGKINILLNNAGIMHPDDGGATNTEDQIWDLTININAKGVFYGCRHGIPALRRAGGGSIINTASFVARLGAATPQIASVLAMSRELAVIHARENIRINALCPGPLRTPLLMAHLNTEEKQQRRLVHIPMGRFGEAHEIAQAAVFLASDESSFITGTDFLVDGGVAAAYVTPEGETLSLPPRRKYE
ncbi:hypothetical protein PSACC_03018 [Paramicrosporidium saccamoebae]|uniref:Short-chain dehydrogenase n=1 Tax=Paramicrosporidium saccamoebae TaxID=1246581 RepID=A0A2H9THH6_9FUNG|nr:hypothetical protein PSACC_03018 [Paramicrosporidium saccamoebae]